MTTQLLSGEADIVERLDPAYSCKIVAPVSLLSTRVQSTVDLLIPAPQSLACSPASSHHPCCLPACLRPAHSLLGRMAARQDRHDSAVLVPARVRTVRCLPRGTSILDLCFQQVQVSEYTDSTQPFSVIMADMRKGVTVWGAAGNPGCLLTCQTPEPLSLAASCQPHGGTLHPNPPVHRPFPRVMPLSHIETFVLVIMMAAFSLYMAPTRTPGVYLTTYVRPQPAFFIWFAGLMLSMTISRIALHYHRVVSASTPSPAKPPKVRRWPRSFWCDIAVCYILLGTLALFVAAIMAPSYSFTYSGLAGWVMVRHHPLPHTHHCHHAPVLLLHLWIAATQHICPIPCLLDRVVAGIMKNADPDWTQP